MFQLPRVGWRLLENGASPDCIIVVVVRLWGPGAWVTLPKEATPDGQVLRAATPQGVLPIIGLVSLPLQTPGATRNGDPWPAPGFTSQSP